MRLILQGADIKPRLGWLEGLQAMNVECPYGDLVEWRLIAASRVVDGFVTESISYRELTLSREVSIRYITDSITLTDDINAWLHPLVEELLRQVKREVGGDTVA